MSGERKDALEAARRILDYWNVPAGRMPRAPHSQDEVLVAQTLLALHPTLTAPLLSTDKAVGELRAAVIEECAKVADAEAGAWAGSAAFRACDNIAKAIRALTASRASKSQGGRNE